LFRSRFFWQLYAGYVLVVLVSALALGGAVARWMSEDSSRETVSELRAKAVLLHDLALGVLDGDAGAAVQARVRELGREASVRLTVIAEDGVVVADSDEDPSAMENHRTRPEVLVAAAEGEGVATRSSETLGVEMTYLARPVLRDDRRLGFVRTSLSSATVDARLGQLRGIVTASAVLASLAALAVGFLAARWITSPLASVTAAAESIAGGEYERRVPTGSRGEIGQLAAAFNAMADHVASRIDMITKDRNTMQAIFASMVEGVIAVDREERIVHMNAIAGRILGVEPGEVVGRRFQEVIPFDELVKELAANLECEHTVPTQAHVMHAAGDHLVEVTASPLRDDADDPVGALVVFHDVTDMHRLELVRSEFVVNASHELKTPIAAIQGILETVAGDPDMPAETRIDFLHRASAQGVRLSSLVTDLIQLSRLESDTGSEDLETIDVRTVARRSIRGLQPVAGEKDIVLSCALPSKPVFVLGDRATIALIVDNLIDNAIKYTGRGGRVDVRAFALGEHVVIEVEDDGVGIDKKDQDRIFERFYRVDKARSRAMGGTGLGLSIVKHACGMLGGELGVESEPGVGSLFRVRLPLHS
jgi:two-component system phosphate regulon sensor histidine kinase PhoR